MDSYSFPRRRFCSTLLAAAALFLVGGAPAQGPSRLTPELRLKAVFLFNFAQFITWPDEGEDASKPFVIGVLGTNPFEDFIEETVAREKVRGRSMQVRYFRRLEEVRECHILYIAGESNRAEERLAAMENQPILTVSSADRFAERGGMIGFFTENNRIRFKINLKQARKAGLIISSKLLRLAVTINE